MTDSRAALFSLEQIGIKLGLEQIQALLTELHRPDRSFPSVVVAGTNGKGSTSAMIERGLRAAGYRTGRYTSPHLVRVEERVAIDGEPVTAEAFDAAMNRVLAAARQLPAPPTFFEATTAIALDTFRTAQVQVAILEVGLGGRLDATNAVDATAAAITSIDFDHEAYLGHTLEAIAGEKAGVIKRGQVVVLAENPVVVDEVVRATCDARGARLIRAGADVTMDVASIDGRTRLALRTPQRNYGVLTLSLRGRHQAQNAVTAVRMLESLDGREGLTVGADAVRVALEDAVWPARLELRTTARGRVLLDGAHNPAGARTLAAYVRETYGRALPFVIGMMADKDMTGIVRPLAEVASHVFAVPVHSPRAAAPEAIAAIVRQVAPEVPVSVATDPSSAVSDARQLGDPVVVAGSLYLAGEVRDLL